MRDRKTLRIGLLPGFLLVIVAVLPLHAAEPANLPLSIVGRFQLKCPVCHTEFTSLACSQSNTRGGVDRDLFARALGPQPEFYRVSTCPHCGYSGYGADFEPDVSLPPDFLGKVLKNPRLELPAEFTAKSDPHELDASVRYRLAITCYRWRQKPDEALAWLNLRSAWIAREEGSSLPPDPRLARVMKFIERWRPPLENGGNQLDVEMKMATRTAEAVSAGEFNRYQQPYVELALALILRRHGENLQAAPLLDRLLKLDSFADPLRTSIRRMRESIDTENQFQSNAADLFERALLADQIVGPNRGPALYLCGELQRRIGRDRQAVKWFDRAIATPDLDKTLAAWAKTQKDACMR